MIRIKHRGNFKNTELFFKKASRMDIMNILKKYGEEGVKALTAATPVDSGKTASCWGYEITGKNGQFVITWTNSNVNDGVNIAIILQYGHGTRNGGYVEGIDYINPAITPILNRLADEAWKEVVNA